MRRRVMLGMPLAGLVSPAAAQAPAAAPRPPAAPTPESLGLSGPRLTQVTDVLAAAVTEGRINGAVFAIQRQGRLAWLQAVGFRDTAQTERLKPDALFPLASMTKPIASVAAMVLVERGRLKLTDPVAAHLPAFRELRVAVEKRDAATGAVELGFDRAHRAITIHDLLRHTAGMTSGSLYPNTPVGRLYNEAGVHDRDQTLASAMDKLATLPLAHQPGSVWAYSIATDVLARVVEVVSGQPFERFVAAQVTAPLRMADTGFTVPARDHARLAQPRIDPLTGTLPPHQDATQPAQRIGGSSGMVGTAGDYLRFCQALLAGGALDGARVLGGGTVSHMLGDHLGAIPQDSPSGLYLLGEGRGFGLGFAIRRGTGVNAMPGSSGDADWAGAYGTQFLIDPARDLAAVLMINQRNQFDHFFRLFRTLVYQTLLR